MDLAAHRILAVNEEELQRIVLDIHDGPVQQMFAALAQVQLQQKRLASGEEIPSAEWDRHLRRIGKSLEEALSHIREFLGTFRSPDFLDRKLSEILQGVAMQFEDVTDCQVNFTQEGEDITVSTPVKIALYRTCQEALFNSFRHSGAGRQVVSLTKDARLVILEISDEGKGFVPPELSGPTATEREEHIGLRGMRDRAGLVGGDFELHSAPGEGTRIVIRVPYVS